MNLLMESDKVDKLYACYGLLADCSSSEIGKHEAVYHQIVSAVTGCEKEKRLACQFIPVFFKHFPDLADLAIEAQFNLCEEKDSTIRKQAIKELPALCRDCPRQTKKVAIILSQLLVVKEQSELRVVHTALMTLFKIDPTATIIALCTVIKTGEEAVRNCGLRFLSLRMRSIAKEIKMPEADEVLIKEIKHLLKKSALEEIPVLIKIALSTNKSHTAQGKNEVSKMLVEEIESHTPFDPHNDENVERLIILLKHVHILLLGVKKARSNRFVLYICEEILPYLSSVSGYKEGTGYALEILQLLAEIIKNTDETTEWDTTINLILKMLMEFIPAPDVDKYPYDEEKIQYSYIECLLFTIHRLTKFNRTVFTKDPDKLKDFRARLQHIACLAKGYCNSLEKRLSVCFEDGPGEKSVLGKRKWFKGIKYATEHNYKDPLFSLIESRTIIKWKNSSESQGVKGTTDINSTNYEQIKSLPEVKKDCLRALAYDTCHNIVILSKDFFDSSVSCQSTVELSFFPASRSVTLDLTRENKKKCPTDIHDGSPTSLDSGSSTHRTPPGSTIVNIRPPVRPKMALYVPPNVRYSSSFRKTH